MVKKKLPVAWRSWTALACARTALSPFSLRSAVRGSCVRTYPSADAQSRVEWEKARWVTCERTCAWRRAAPVIALRRTMSGAVVAAASMLEEKAEEDMVETGALGRC